MWKEATKSQGTFFRNISHPKCAKSKENCEIPENAECAAGSNCSFRALFTNVRMRNAEHMLGVAALTFGVSLLIKVTRSEQRLNELFRRPDQTGHLLTGAARDSIRDRGAGAVAELATWLLDRSDVAGLSCAIVKHGKLVWASGFGLCNIERQLAFTESTICPIGSVSACRISNTAHLEPCIRSRSWLAPLLL